MTKVTILPDDDGNQPLYAPLKKIYQARVRGIFRRTKWAVMALLLGLYYVLPWVRYDRGPFAPDQAILVDTINRKFYFFFIELWPQEVYYFTGLLVIAALGLFFMTAMFGRIWCGYMCPQTVWTDLFQLIERRIEGDRNTRRKLDQGPWTFAKLYKRLLKHSIWLLIGLATGGAWVFYFQDAPTLFNQIIHWQIPFVAGFWMVFLTLSTYLMAGHARDQVCTYMCPYARFQGAMFDEDTLIVAYDNERGEPRGKGQGAGDCVDCDRCVAVCPVGIDIRDGQQYQCINCGLCIDACNTVMKKLGRKLGLIRYNTFSNTVPAGCSTVQTFKNVHLLRPRTIAYGLIILAVCGVMLETLLTRPLVDLNVIRERNPLYITLADGSIRNAYTVHIINKTNLAQNYNLTVPTLPKARVKAQNYATAHNAVTLPVNPGKVGIYKVFVDAPSTAGRGSMPIIIAVSNGEYTDEYATKFVFPKTQTRGDQW